MPLLRLSKVFAIWHLLGYLVLATFWLAEQYFAGAEMVRADTVVATARRISKEKCIVRYGRHKISSRMLLYSKWNFFGLVFCLLMSVVVEKGYQGELAKKISGYCRALCSKNIWPYQFLYHMLCRHQVDLLEQSGGTPRVAPSSIGHLHGSRSQFMLRTRGEQL